MNQYILKKSIIFLSLLTFVSYASAQQKTLLADKEGVSVSYQFKPSGSRFVDGNEVNEYELTLVVDNDCGSDINISTPFSVRWINPVIKGSNQGESILRVGGRIGNGRSSAKSSTINVPSSFQGDLINMIQLKYVEASGVFQKLNTVRKSSETSYSEQARLARQQESNGDYEAAKKSWERALASKPNDATALQKIKEMEERATAQRSENYRKGNLQAQELRNQKETSARNEQFNLMADGVGIIYKNLGVDKDNNVFVQSTRRFNLTLGFSFALMPIYSNNKSENYFGTAYNYTYTTETRSIPTLNLDFGLQFWPWYGENWGVGLLAEGFGGFLPLAGTNFSYQYNYGFQAIAGSKKVKASFKYLLGDRGISYSDTFSGGTGSSKSFYSGEGATYFSRIVIGPRFTFTSSEGVKRHLEVNYMMETYKNMTQIKSMGFNLTFVSDNRLRYYVDWMTNAARIGEINYELETGVTNQGFMLTIGVIRSFDWFGRK